MNAKNAFLIAGFSAAALSVAAILGFSNNKEEAATNAQTESPAPKVASIDAATTPIPTGDVSWEELQSYTKWHTNSFVTDVLRSTHIAVGKVTAVQTAARVEITFEPITYLKGAPLPQQSIQIKTETNAYLDVLVGQTVPIAFIERDIDGVVDYGACHGVNSITPASQNPQATIDFYQSMIEIYDIYKQDVDAAVEANPDDGRFAFPDGFILSTKNLLLENYAISGSATAYRAARELRQNPLFADSLDSADLEYIADSIRASQPASFDRGVGYIMLNDHNAPLLTNEDILSLCRSETRMINFDHLGKLIAEEYNPATIVPSLADIFLNKSGEETNEMRRNAIELAAQIGSKIALPYMDAALGKMPDRKSQRSLLNAYRFLHHPRNFRPLVTYLNGGIPSEFQGDIANVGSETGTPIQRTNFDTLESIELMKRTILAIAEIDSEESNLYVKMLLKASRAQWQVNFLTLLQEENKEWRKLNEILEEGDKSALTR